MLQWVENWLEKEDSKFTDLKVVTISDKTFGVVSAGEAFWGD